jgi:hypothetical protein
MGLEATGDQKMERKRQFIVLLFCPFAVRVYEEVSCAARDLAPFQGVFHDPIAPS